MTDNRDRIRARNREVMNREIPEHVLYRFTEGNFVVVKKASSASDEQQPEKDNTVRWRDLERVAS